VGLAFFIAKNARLLNFLNRGFVNLEQSMQGVGGKRANFYEPQIFTKMLFIISGLLLVVLLNTMH